jgi:hypothetical protein
MNESVVTIKKALKIKNNLRQIDHRVVVCLGRCILPAHLKLSEHHRAFSPHQGLASKASPHHAFSYFLYIKHFAAFEYARTCST